MAPIPDYLQFATMVDTLETYAHFIFIVLALYYVYLFIRDGDNRKPKGTGFGLGPEAGKKAVKGAKKAGKLLRKTTKLEIEEYIDLEKLKKAINNTKVGTDAELVKVGNPKAAKRKEAKAYSRFSKLESAVQSAGLDSDPAIKKLLKNMEVFTTDLVAKLKDYDTALAISTSGPAAVTVDTKKKEMSKALDAAISADRGFIAEAEKLQKVLSP